MKVERRIKRTDCFVGDIILFDSIPCMVIDMGEDSDYFGILALEGVVAGEVIAEFEGLHEIDVNEKTTELLMKKDAVIICKEGSECQF